MRYLRSFCYTIPIGLLVLLALDLALRPALVDEISENNFYRPSRYAPIFSPDHYGALRPNLRLDLTESPSQPFLIETNSFGMRMGEIAVEKDPQITRVAVMGDSIAFGWRMAPEAAFPSQLESLLNHEDGKKYEVLNFAAPGFTTFHAVKQYERLVHNFQPDILVLAFGLYDSYECRLSEPEFYTILEEQGALSGAKGVLGFMNSYSAVGYWMAQRKREQLNSLIQSRTGERIAQNDWRKKVSPDSMKIFLGAIIEHQRAQGGAIVLVNDNLFNFDASSALEDVSEKYGAPLLDLRSIFDGIGGYEERRKHFELDLADSGIDYFNRDDSSDYLFRAQTSDERALSRGVFIAGDHPDLGGEAPYKVRMYDDGTHGDEKAGDRIWSLQISIKEPEPVHFTFTVNGVEEQRGDRQAEYENDSKNHVFVHLFSPPPSESTIHWRSPVYSVNRIPFEHLLLDSNSQYPNELGHRLIAHRLSKMIQDLSVESSETITQKSISPYKPGVQR
ncbi:MAG: SGNH/GDSL hydrolase family protein [Candidatus Omnitrophica bacterium]|nr:SGNH/GDSL hydrolase family protein [Candidatus Omnitrophota bacterium]